METTMETTEKARQRRRRGQGGRGTGLYLMPRDEEIIERLGTGPNLSARIASVLQLADRLTREEAHEDELPQRAA
jgi:hypothetical protein